jgi:elongator complex protein 3
MVQGSQQKDVLELCMELPLPVVFYEIGNQELRPRERSTLPGDIDHGATCVDPQVAPVKTAPGQPAGELTRAASQIENARRWLDRADGAHDPGLKSTARAGEIGSEVLVEFPVNPSKCLDHVLSHTRIISRCMHKEAWLESRQYTPDQLTLARVILEEVRSGSELHASILRHPQPGGGHIPKHALVHAYRELVRLGEWSPDPGLLRRIRMKPVRTLSGVTTVTVMTKPYACPGKCIFCPTDVRVPKSYLPDEPGAMRAVQHHFDPFDQTAARLEALHAIGHPTDKIELLILGGTWSAYRRDYQEWFVQRCLDALNGFDSKTLSEAQTFNSGARHRNVGLVIETRPDHVDRDEIARLRRLGVTKVQMGAQSMDDAILLLNRRGHTVEETRKAVSMLRAAGFKIVLHWMPNLLGATPESDRQDFQRLWDIDGPRPDEIKIYPCQLLANAELYATWQQGGYAPYSTQTLINLIADVKPSIPRYCRVNRVIRDIPSTNVVAGNKRTSLRQDVHRELERRGTRCECIRCREIRGREVDPRSTKIDHHVYTAGGAQEHFISFVTRDDRLVGYVRLSLPGPESPQSGIPELADAALVRELHVYGQSLPVGSTRSGAAQHTGLGARLMAEAEALAAERGYSRVAVISALGTRPYYRKLGYALGGTYMVKSLHPEAERRPKTEEGGISSQEKPGAS